MTSPARRRSLIRGDGLTAGVVLVLSGTGAWCAALVHLMPKGGALLGGLALVGAGLALIAHERRAWRALLHEVAAPWRGHDPGPSPVPWIADAVWRQKNTYDPALDAPSDLLAEIDPLVRPFSAGVEPGEAVREPVLRPVADSEKELTPTEGPVGDPPEPGTAEAVRTRLEGTPGRAIVVSPRWPVCCGRPATLEGLRMEDRHPACTWLPPDGPEAERDPGAAPRGTHSWRCRACGRRYATDPAW